MENEDIIAMKKIKLIYDEFKNPNFNIRLFKVQHLGILMELMSKEQIKEELLPSLLEFIFNYETNDEVLCEYSHQLKNIFIMFLKEEKIVKEPLKILMWLSNNEDEQIRKAAYTNINEILNYYHDEKFIEIELIPLLNENGNKKKYTQCQLIPLFYNYVSVKFRDILAKNYIALCCDESIQIRRIAAINIRNFHLINDKSPMIISLAEENLRMLSDPSEIVRVNAIESTIYLIKILPHEKQMALIINSMNESLNQEKSWRIKHAMTTFICSVCHCFKIQFNEEYFLPLLQQSLKENNEFEVRLNTLTNISSFFSCISEKTLIEKLVKIFKNELINDPNWNIRAANGVILLKLLNKLSIKEETAIFYSIVNKIIKDDLFEVKYYLMSRINVLFIGCDINKFEGLIQNVYFPIITEGLQCNNWRLRYEIEKSFYDLIHQYPNWILQKQEILKFIYRFFTDNASEIRQSSLKLIEFIIKAYPDIINDILQIQQVTLNSSNYSIRIFSIKSIVSLLPYYHIEILQKTYIPLLVTKFGDSIINVRLYAYEAIVFLISLINNKPSHQSLIEVIKSTILNSKIAQYADITNKLKQINLL